MIFLVYSYFILKMQRRMRLIANDNETVSFTATEKKVDAQPSKPAPSATTLKKGGLKIPEIFTNPQPASPPPKPTRKMGQIPKELISKVKVIQAYQYQARPSSTQEKQSDSPKPQPQQSGNDVDAIFDDVSKLMDEGAPLVAIMSRLGHLVDLIIKVTAHEGYTEKFAQNAKFVKLMELINESKSQPATPPKDSGKPSASDLNALMAARFNKK